MLTFLRQIRRSIVGKGSARNYIFYAIGEIALVVFGILIALQINNWDQENRYRELERRHLENTVQQLLLDKETLRSELNYNSLLTSHFLNAKRIIGQNQLSEKDSLGRMALYLTEHTDFRRKSDVYQSHVSSGEIKHLRSLEIRTALQVLEETYQYINRLEDSHNDVILELVGSQLIVPLRLDPLEVKQPEVLFDYKFENLFSIALDLIAEEDGLYHQAISEIDQTIEVIVEYLETL